jgi:hypothetical protein
MSLPLISFNEFVIKVLEEERFLQMRERFGVTQKLIASYLFSHNLFGWQRDWMDGRGNRNSSVGQSAR